MSEVMSYEQWKSEAKENDKKSGADNWKHVEKTGRYDYSVIRKRYDELIEIRSSNDSVKLLYYLNEGIHGNMAGMGSPALYSKALVGTKVLVEAYIDELVAALQQLHESESRQVSQSDKLRYFRQASMCFGRTALMFGGAGSLGAFHIGVAKALVSEGLLPNVISGASTGAFVAALVGTRESAKLSTLLFDENLAEALHFDTVGDQRRRIDMFDLERMIAKLIPDLTFTEAFQHSGIHLNISVAPSELQQRSRLLNMTTSPNAYVREAVLASCAVPGLFPPVKLKAKDHEGQRQPYIPSRSWIDGSIAGALPTKRLARLYGANHFISSQANPIAVLANKRLGGENSIVDKWINLQQSASREWLRAIFPFAMEGIKDIYPINVYAQNWFSNVTQDFSADVNILPDSGTSRPGLARPGLTRPGLTRPGQLFETLTNEETTALIDEGETCTWPAIERIRMNTAVSRCIEEILTSYGEGTVEDRV